MEIKDKVEVIINKDRKVEMDYGDSLLSNLRKEKIFIPSACGGRSMCGYCKLKITEGVDEIKPMDRRWLSDEELEENYRLACQLKVKDKLSIEIPERVFKIGEFKGKVIEIKSLTERIKKLVIQLPKGRTLDYKPGQFVQVRIPSYEKTNDYKGNPKEIYRTFSLASDIEDKSKVELIIGFTGGFGTTYLHKILKVGDILKFNGPHGYFYYQDDDSDIVFAATGTGYSPIRAILYYMRDKNIKRRARFYFGARTPEDLFLSEEMDMFEKELYDFKYMPTLSRVTEDINWNGDRGRVNTSIDKYLDENKDYSAYLCGSSKVISTVVDALVDKNVSKDKIYYDKF